MSIFYSKYIIKSMNDVFFKNIFMIFCFKEDVFKIMP